MSALVTDENVMRWLPGAQRGHYEVWYATLTHLASRTGFWIRYTLEAPVEGHGAPYAQLWFARFDPSDPSATFGINHKLPIRELRHEQRPFRLRLGDAELRSDGMRGAIAGCGHQASWDFSWRPSETLHRHLMSAAYRGGWADTKVLTPNLNVAARGHLTVDGKRYQLSGDPLGQTHLWGRKHAYGWAWSHCNAFQGDRGCALETLTVRLKRGPLVLPPLTMLSLYLDGEQPDLIEVREPWKLPLARSSYGTGRYALSATLPLHKLEIELTCRPEDMLLTEYTDPDGEAAFCHNTECADARVKVWKRSPFSSRFREWKVLTSDRSAHWEWGARAGDALVKKRHVTIE